LDTYVYTDPVIMLLILDYSAIDLMMILAGDELALLL
jgi:hypothetical protein